MKTLNQSNFMRCSAERHKRRLLAGDRYWTNVAKSRVEWAVFIVLGVIVAAVLTVRIWA